VMPPDTRVDVGGSVDVLLLHVDSLGSAGAG
jgi:hypothetical protein